MTMSKNTETTSNSIKFAPIPMSALLANLLPLQRQNDSPDSSYTSVDESDNSFGDTVAKKPKTAHDEIRKSLFQTPQTKPMTQCTSEKKGSYSDKENCNNNSFSNQTYPSKDIRIVKSVNKNTHFNSYQNAQVKKHTNLEPQNCNVRLQDSLKKKTPESSKVVNSNSKPKISTPKISIKTGIRKFTPGSTNRSNKKTPLKTHTTYQNKESARCLFPEDTTESQCPPPQPKVTPHPLPPPDTPVNKPPPVIYAATPSYPQNIISQHSKELYKTTVIKGKKYLFLKKLGAGGSSVVYKALEIGTSCEYAVKCVDLATDQELLQGYINEVQLLRELQNSDRVIRLHDFELDKENQLLRMVLEVGETDLSSFLKARGPGGLPPALVLHYWEEMLHAVHYIHEHGVIHADLKPANFLLVCGRLKLIDFGIASAISSDATSVVRAQAAGTYSYISPEALMGGAGGYGAQHGDGTAPIKISFRSDVWSLGCILYSMIYGTTPFGHIRNLAKLAAILDPKHRIDYPPVERLPPTLLAVLKRCLTYNARSRPSVRELLSVSHLQAARAPLPSALLAKLRPLVTPHELRLLQQATLPLHAPPTTDQR